MPAQSWRRIVALALAGTVVAVVLVLLNVRAIGGGVRGLLHAGVDGPSADVIVDDLGGPLDEGTGHDGQQFYAVARNPLSLDEAADSLDRPRYRLQRPAFPVLAWALHPSGGGPGLVWALFAVGAGALFLGGAAAGWLSVRFGGSPLVAAVLPLLPGSLFGLRLTLADPLAVGLALAAISLDASGRRRAAIVLGVAAVLTRESSLVLLAGWMLAAPGDRQRRLLVAVPGAVTLAWAGVLWAVFPGQPLGVGELGLPFAGIVSSLSTWAAGEHLVSPACLALAAALGLVALRRQGLRSPLGPAIGLQLVFLTLLSDDVVALSQGGIRTTTTLLLLAGVALTAPPARAPAGLVPVPA